MKHCEKLLPLKWRCFRERSTAFKLSTNKAIKTSTIKFTCEIFSLKQCLLAGKTAKKFFTLRSNPSTFREVTASTNSGQNIRHRTPTLQNLRDNSCMNRFSDSNAFWVKDYSYPLKGIFSQNSDTAVFQFPYN